jgi:uncharacterized protein (TIGR02270 family)
MMQSSVVPFVIEQHAEELATLWATRSDLAANGQVRLRHLARFDERIAAHEDACLIGKDQALRVLTDQLGIMSAGRVFAVAVAGIDLGDPGTISRCIALAEASPDARRGMTSALGWVGATCLKGIVRDLLNAPSATRHSLGLAACRLHGVDPGPALTEALGDSSDEVRAEAVRAAGVLGRTDFVSSIQMSIDGEGSYPFWSAWAAVLHGNHGSARDVLLGVALKPGPRRPRAFRLVLQAMSISASHGVLQQLNGNPHELRWLIQGSGIAGDPTYVPWLIKHMSNEKTARLAAEAFSLIAGVDLSASKLDGQRPENFESGPNDDPEDPNVEMDPDDGLPWPDPQLIEKWWATNERRFQKSTRYFVGGPVTREHCIHVLKTGYQRQRILAAHYLCLLNPGTPLFNTSAPAWRQQRLLASMT